MQRLRKSGLIIAVLMLGLCSVLGAASLFAASAGRASSEVAGDWQIAASQWQNRNVGGALRSGLAAYRTSVDAGARYLIAGRVMSGVQALESIGQIEPAIALCNQSVRVLDRFDDHGWQTFECLAIIDRQNSRQCIDSCEGVCWSYNRSACVKQREQTPQP